MTRIIPGTWAGRIASPRTRKLQHTASAGWATWMMPIVATSTSRWAKAINPWPSIPVSTESRATAIHALAESGQMSSPASTMATGAAVSTPIGIIVDMKSTTSTVARARRPVSR